MRDRSGFDPLGVAALLSMVIVGVVVSIDILNDGKLDPAVLALFVSVLSPVVPAMLIRYGGRRNGSDDS